MKEVQWAVTPAQPAGKTLTIGCTAHYPPPVFKISGDEPKQYGWFPKNFYLSDYPKKKSLPVVLMNSFPEGASSSNCTARVSLFFLRKHFD